MKIVAVDTSHHASLQKVKSFLKLHSDADIVYSFDCQLHEYLSVQDFMEECDLCPGRFFSKPCAYFDMVTAIIAIARRCRPDSIIICSPAHDECSRTSNEEKFNNFIQHFCIYHPDILMIESYGADHDHISDNHSFHIPVLSLRERNPLKFTDTEPTEEIEECDEFDEYYEPGHRKLSFSLIDHIVDLLRLDRM